MNKVFNSKKDESPLFDAIKNLTPHTISVIREDDIYEFEPEGIVARVSQDCGKINIENINRELKHLRRYDLFIYTEYSDPINLPDESEDKIYIVSTIVKQACIDRSDLVSPSDFVRDETGNIIGCRSLSF
jgi:hypothetical protein